MNLGSLNVAMPEAGDFVESLQPYSNTRLRRADHSSRGVLPSVRVSMSMIKPKNNPQHLQEGDRRYQTKKLSNQSDY
jgi:hypothetical protein